MKNLISKLLIISVVLFTALSVFWFFKTSSVKKQTLLMISSSDGKAAAASVSVSGFPFKQILKIEDLKIQILLPSGLSTSINGKYQIDIKKFEAASSIFSSNFKTTNIENVALQNQDGSTNSLQFNQAPKLEFVISGDGLEKLSYQDSGYKIVDAANNVLFENGSSSVNFESKLEDKKYHNKIMAEFKDISSFGLAEPSSAPSIDASKASPVAATPSATDSAATTENAEAKPVSETPAPSPSNQVDNSIKKNISVDLEYIVSNPSEAPAAVPNPEIQETATSDTKSTDEKTIESLNIKNIEISSALYKLNINGTITSFQKGSLPIGNVSVRIEKLDNVLTYIKKSLSSISNKPSNITTGNLPDPVKSAEVATSPNSDSATLPASNQKALDIAAVVKDLSKKNPATNEEIAVFDFRQEQGKDLLINETSFLEIENQVSTNLKNSGAENGNNTTAPASEEKVAPTASTKPAAEKPSTDKPAAEKPAPNKAASKKAAPNKSASNKAEKSKKAPVKNKNAN
ncbi:MAG: hypothetical protein K0R25_568 [Rickettsiaceae bacterium]|jgi:hypothetical protein|nr:hypothetical protein [Rickettsiaceae bacterium]